jgi:hypothetical protein
MPNRVEINEANQTNNDTRLSVYSITKFNIEKYLLDLQLCKSSLNRL